MGFLNRISVSSIPFIIYEEENPSIPSKTIECSVSLQQMQLASKQSNAIAWLQDLHVQTLSANCVLFAVSFIFNLILQLIIELYLI
jgi:hypothetical protein